METIKGQLRVLASDDIYRVHAASLQVLDRVGVRVLGKEALELLDRAGARVDFDKKLASIPEHLVQEAIKKAPHSFTLYGRDPKNQVRFESKNSQIYFSMTGSPVKLLDLEDGTCRASTVRDLERFFVLADALENIDHAGCAVWPTDVPDSVSHLYALLAGFENTTKSQDGYNEGEAVSYDTIRMASVVTGSEEELKKKPILLGITQPVSPLEYSRENAEGLIVYARYNQPQIIVPWPQGGATAPVTLAGALVQQNAEILGEVVIAQLASPGAPMVFGCTTTFMDQRTGCPSIGGAETCLMNAASAQLARYYDLPSRGTICSDSKVPDAQAGLEKAMGLLTIALSGVNFVYHAVGSLGSTSTASYEQAVIDNEICGRVRRILRGIEVDEATLAVDVIEDVGPGGSFLTQAHTLRHYGKEVYAPTITDRKSRGTWEKAGSKDLRAAAREEAKRILKEHKPEPLDPHVKEELHRVVKDLARSRETKSS